MLDKIALVLVIIGALNWGSIGIFSFDIVAWAFGLAGIWCISLLFRSPETNEITE